MNKVSIALLLLGSLSSMAQVKPAQSNKPYTYQSNVLGVTTYQQWSAKHANIINQGGVSIPAFNCGDPVHATRDCYLGDAESSFRFVDDRLASINMEIGKYELPGYVQGLTAKFGEPVVTTAPYVNAMGASLTGQIWTWKNPLGQIVLTQYGGESINLGTLTYSDTKLATEYTRRLNPAPSL